MQAQPSVHNAAVQEEQCKSADVVERNECHAFLNGVLQGHTLMAGTARRPGIYCWSGPVAARNTQTVSSVYQSFIEQYPQLRDQSAGAAVLLAMENAYPCAD